MGEFLTGFFAQIWRIFQMSCGLFGLTFGDILLGGFVVTLGITIFHSVAAVIGSAFQKQTGGIIEWRKNYLAKKNEEHFDYTYTYKG